LNSIRFSRSFFLRFAAGLKEHSVTTALLLCSTRADVLTNSLSLYIHIRRKPRARTKKVNRSKRSKRQTRRRRRRRKMQIRIRKTQTSSTIYPATKSTSQTSSPVDVPVDRRGRCLRNRCTPRRT